MSPAPSEELVAEYRRGYQDGLDDRMKISTNAAPQMPAESGARNQSAVAAPFAASETEPRASWVKFAQAAGETPEGIAHRALVNIASISPLSTVSPREIARTALDAADMLRQAQPSARAACAWTQDADGIYHTGCGNAWFFDTGTVAENKAKFCLYCGGDLIAKEHEDDPV